MRIRNGEYLDENQQPTAEFFEIIEQYKARVAYAAEHTDLPERPDEKKIRELVLAIHEKIVLEEQWETICSVAEIKKATPLEQVCCQKRDFLW